MKKIPFRIAKAATNGNHSNERLCLKSNPQVKCVCVTEAYQQDKPRKAWRKLSTFDTAYKSPTVWKGLFPGQKGPKVRTATINNSFRTAKAATNGNQRLCLKSKP